MTLQSHSTLCLTSRNTIATFLSFRPFRSSSHPSLFSRSYPPHLTLISPCFLRHPRLAHSRLVIFTSSLPDSVHLCCSPSFFFSSTLAAQPSACCYGYKAARAAGGGGGRSYESANGWERERERERLKGGWERACVCEDEKWKMGDGNCCHNVGAAFLFKWNNVDSLSDKVSNFAVSEKKTESSTLVWKETQTSAIRDLDTLSYELSTQRFPLLACFYGFGTIFIDFTIKQFNNANTVSAIFYCCGVAQIALVALYRNNEMVTSTASCPRS